MKNLIILIIGICFISILDTNNTNATQYTWTGSVDTAWSTAGNWSPAGPPGATTDTVTIVTGSNQCHLTANTTIGRLTLTSGTLQMHAYTLTISTRSSFNGGTVYGTANNAVKSQGTRNTFAGTTFNAEIEAIGGQIELNGSTFNDTCYFEQTGASTGDGQGGNTFDKPVTIINNCSVDFKIAQANANTFNDKVTFTMLGSQNLSAANSGKTAFNGNIIINCTGNGNLNIGHTNGDTASLATGKTITVGSTGFSSGTLLLRRFIQTGSTAQSITFTGTAVLNLINARFNGKVTISSPTMLAKSSEFNDTLSVTQTNTASGVNWDGGNTFSGVTTITNTGTRELRMTATTRNVFNTHVTFTTTSSGVIRPYYTDTSEVKGNMTANGSNVELDAGTGAVKFTGSNTQHITGDRVLEFKKIKIHKSAGTVTLDTAINVTDTLKFVDGTLTTTASDLLTMKAGSTVTGATDTGFVSGPVKKIGNTAFDFPTGKGTNYRAIAISAPSSSSHAFTAEYFNVEQTQGVDIDTTINYLSPCSYWKLDRTTGSSNVTIKLSWDNTGCGVEDTLPLRIAYWNSGNSKWVNKGHGTISGSPSKGTILSDSAFSSFGYFNLAASGAGGSCSVVKLGVKELIAWGGAIFLGECPLPPQDDYIPHFVQGNGGVGLLENVQSVSTGGSFNLALINDGTLANDGTVYSWGFNGFGQLGNNSTSSSSCPVQVVGGTTPNPFLQRIAAISAGQDHALALLCNGRVVAWGRNEFGQLGNNSTTDRDEPVHVHGVGNIGSLENVVAISAGAFHSMALLGDGTVVAWGGNTFGELGTNNNTQSSFPVVVLNPGGTDPLENIVSIAAGGATNIATGRRLCSSSFAIDDAGDLYAWGSDNYGQLGDGTTGSPLFVDLPQQVTALSDVRTIDAGATHVAAIVGVDREIFCWGGNAWGQVGNGNQSTAVNIPTQVNVLTITDPAIEVTAGGAHTVALTENNGSSADVYTWGRNNSQQLGLVPATPFADEPQLLSNIPQYGPDQPCDIGITYCINNLTAPAGSSTLNVAACGIGNPITVQGTIRVPPGADFTIGTTVEFGPNGRIIVERGDGVDDGGILHLDGATLTVISGTIAPSCMWQGIQAYGYNNQPQNSQQAHVYVTNSTIEYAHVGIYAGKKFITECNTQNLKAFSGAIINAVNDNNFIDNNIGIEFAPGYGNFPSGSAITNFTGSTTYFDCIDVMRDPRYNYERSAYFIKVNHMDGLLCAPLNVFRNLPANTSNNTTAVQLGNGCINSKFLSNEFHDCNIAAQITNPSNMLGINVIGSNTIDASNIGIFISKSRDNDVAPVGSGPNTISNGVGAGSIGIHNEFARGTLIRGNIIDDYTFGINVIESGINNAGFQTEIKKNIIGNSSSTLDFAVQAVGRNRYTQWWCNDFFNYDVNGFRILDLGASLAVVQEQGKCDNNQTNPPDFPAGNAFNVSNANNEIQNSTGGTFDLSYVFNNVNNNTVYEPDPVSGDVIVTGCTTIGMPTEPNFCATQEPEERPIAEILAERDTITDTLQISLVNKEALRYYISNSKMDSAIWFLETYSFEDEMEILISLYIEEGMFEEAHDLIEELTTETEDEQDIADLYTLLLTLADEERDFFDMDEEEHEFIATLSEKYTDAGRGALAIMNMLYGTPFTIPCEALGNCEARFSNPAITQQQTGNAKTRIFVLNNIPNPFSQFTIIIIPEEMRNAYSLKLCVYDYTGKMIKEDKVPYGSVAVQVTAGNLNNGVYFYSFKGQNKNSAIGRMSVIK